MVLCDDRTTPLLEINEDDVAACVDAVGSILRDKRVLFGTRSVERFDDSDGKTQLLQLVGVPATSELVSKIEDAVAEKFAKSNFVSESRGLFGFYFAALDQEPGAGHPA